MQRNDIRLDGTSVVERDESRQVERIEDLGGFQLSPPVLFLVGLALGGVGSSCRTARRCSFDVE